MIGNKYNVSLKCPLCKTQLVYKGLSSGVNLIICDDVEGGCGEYFVASVEVGVIGNSYKINKEG